MSSDTFKTHSGRDVVIESIKHGSLSISYAGTSIQVDPCADLPPCTDYSKYPKADIILITHQHFDHFDKDTVNLLSTTKTQIILNEASFEKLGRGTVLKNGDTRQLTEDIAVEAVPAYNTTPAHMKYHPKGKGNGYVLTIDGLRIYIAGDTEDIPEMAGLKAIDIAFLPCNQPYTMTPVQLVRASKALSPKVLFPYHYSDTKIEQVKTLLDDTEIDVRIRQMQ